MDAAETMNSREKFLEDFSTLSGAAVGVVAVRTRETYRFLDALKDFSYDKKMAFQVWKITSGWNKYNIDDPEADPTADNESAIVAAVKKIAEDGVKPGVPVNAKGYVYAMFWPHHFCNRDKAMADITQLLADYSKLFSEQKKRLVLFVPPEYKMPAELEDMMLLLDADLPAQEELLEVYQDIVAFIDGNTKEAAQSKNPEYSDEEISRITSAGAGMTISEFENTISRAFVTFRNELPEVPIEEFVRLVSKTKAEIVKRSDVLELMPLGNMAEVGGLENLKEWIELRKGAYNPDAREFGVDKPNGCALIGPPGTGKSLCAKAIAHTLGLPLIKLDISRAFGSLVGQSEERIREALKLCAAMAPCTVLIDEVDKAFDQNSGGGDSGVGKRVLGAVLTFMQECEKEVFWVMTANRVGGLPPELLRKGRLDEVFSVTLPGANERKAILDIHLKKRKQSPKDIKGLAKVIDACAGFVGAEIEGAVKEAVLLAYSSKGDVTADLLIQQFAHTKPLAVAHAEQFTAMREWAEANARPAGKDTPPETPRESSGRERSRSMSQKDTLGKKSPKMDLDG